MFLLAAAAVADEIFLIRLLSLRFWPHFVPLILSQAMLGFGASGILLHGLRRPIARRPEPVFAGLILCAAPSFDLAFRLSQRIPFDPYLLLWNPSSWGSFALFFLVLSVPFLLAGGAVGVPLACRLGDPGWVYGASFAGSAAGALLAVPAAGILPAGELLRLCTGLGLAAAFPVLPVGRPVRIGVRVLGVFGILGVLLLPAADPVLSPYKDLAVANRLPEVRPVLRVDGPSGEVRILSAPGLHVAPGLSIRFPGEVPAQAALFSDGELRGILPVPDGKPGPRYLSWVPEALPYRLLERPRVLQVSLRGTEGILSAAANGAASVTVVEPSREIVTAVRGWDRRTGHLPEWLPIRILPEGPRSFLARSRERFELVEFSGVSSISYATVGIHAAGETFLLTRQGIGAALSRLAPGGLLSFSGWLKVPPRESVKILRTLREVLENRGLGPASSRILLIRGFGTFTIVARTVPFSRNDRKEAESFCARTGFSMIWPPGGETGISPEDHALARSVESVFSGGAATGDGLFDLRPVDDDSPYFYRFLRPGAIGEFRRLLGSDWVPFLEWGVLFLLLSLGISSAVSAILLLGPVLAGRSARRGITLFRAGYFGLLGAGYMLVELTYLKFGILLAGHPFPAAVAAIGGFTFFSGTGSLLSGRLAPGGVARRALFPGIAVLSAGGFFLLARCAPSILPAPGNVRLALFCAASAPAAVLMGIPFPAGLLRLGEDAPDAVPFAWGVNGFCSVVGASLASAGALWLGFRGTVAAGALSYLVAGLLFGRLAKAGEERGRGAEVTGTGGNG
ncbi:MAG: hypothetical protein Kow00128_13250 [Deltaproteobacteria bacterium]